MPAFPYPVRPVPAKRAQLMKKLGHVPQYYLLVVVAKTRLKRKIQERLVLVPEMGEFEPGDEVIAVIPRGKARINLTKGAAFCMMGRAGYRAGNSGPLQKTSFEWLWRPPCLVGNHQVEGFSRLIIGLITPEARMLWFGTDDSGVKTESLAVYRNLYFKS